METPPTVNASQGDSVTAGISRSGRVRKKSSKLLDFQSPDELEKKPKRAPKPLRSGLRGRPPKDGRKKNNDTDNVADDNDGNESDSNDEQLSDVPLENALVAPDSEDELDELVADLVEGVEAESLEHANNHDSKVRQSLYMTEKSNKRKFLQDGKVITRKLERKDKGKSRYTAYSMWAREFRKTSKFSKNQDLDFSNTARRLGELWANVSNKEKNTWRRRAKLEAGKARITMEHAKLGLSAKHSLNSAFFNRATTSRTKKLAEVSKSLIKDLNNSETNNIVKKKKNYTTNNGNNSAHITTNEVPSQTYPSTNAQNSKIIPLSSIEPIDTAAHLKLLGESLTIIGERLKEHEGQIAVSGSLSVLLDSLLCSLGPLLCLTTKIPGLEHKSQLSENLSSTLDNIAYVMPGL
ncbi:HMG box-containing protein 4-like [Teleopsis dalmanni]|uniref:HMG box-containing protein 4-like n=1 Tax=Teleopsis dalmanni TaxID=139649 RepID=UPI0018CEE244|nr:HMG box-containing protein 4-like isoform X3 [Teleopsis dalmanni]XP_037938889.1 HMG box-containing protein 4-like isoform X4 [Teleopsis dalmanni]XP_037940610.1 HMG box-containing protein 4-like [Teleopsis dalmanni]